MEIKVLVFNTKAILADKEGNRSGIFTLPLSEEDVREQLGFDEAMTGLWIDCTSTILENEAGVDITIEEVNYLYYQLENLKGKIHEDDILEVEERWFSTLKELCENISFVEWMQGEDGMEEMARKDLELYASSIPDRILKCVDIVKYANDLVKSDKYLVTAHGVYYFDEPVH